MKSTTATEQPPASASIPARYVIRANNPHTGEACMYWMQNPYESDGVQYHWATHYCGAAIFDDREIAERMAAVMNVDHAQPTVVSLEVVTREHTAPPASFPFSVFHITTAAELAAADDDGDGDDGDPQPQTHTQGLEL